jgi:uncharacterized membrane protein
LALVIVKLTFLAGHAVTEALLFSSTLAGVLLSAVLGALQGYDASLKGVDLAPLAF